MLFKISPKVALVSAIFCQLVLGVVPAQKYGGRYVQKTPDGIYGWWTDATGNSMVLNDMAAVARQAAIDAITVAQLGSPSPIPAGVTVYCNDAGNLVIAAIGAGTGLHGEQNVQRVCAEKNIPFQGGRIATFYYQQQAFIGACAQPNEGAPDARNCIKLLNDNGIDDVYQRLHKKSISERNEEVQDVAVPFVA